MPNNDNPDKKGVADEPEEIQDSDFEVIEPIRDKLEDMLSPEELEARKRGITVEQWQAVLHLAEAAGKTKEWIDEIFSFNGLGKIIVGTQLDLSGCTGLTHLPEGLEVWWGYLNIMGCTGLTQLPDDLDVRLLILSHDLQEQVKQEAEQADTFVP